MNVIDLNLKCKTMKLLEDLGGNLDNLRFGDELKAQRVLVFSNMKSTIHERKNG